MDIFFLLIGLISLIILLAIWNQALFYLYVFVRSKKWQSVKGTIQSSKVQGEEKETDNRGLGELIPVSFSTVRYRPEISYRYEINGKEYIGHERVRDLVLEKDAEEILGKYPIGMQVNVFYNPQKPLESTLKTGYKIRKEDYFITILVSIIVMLCVCAALFK